MSARRSDILRRLTWLARRPRLARWTRCLVAAAGVWAAAAETGRAEQGAVEALRSPTLGGLQFWTDEFVWRPWRIQRHSEWPVYRLLDEQDRLRAIGGWDHCQRRWQRIGRPARRVPLERRVVILLHGLGRTRHAMDGMRADLDERLEADVITFGYASTRGSLDDHAASLARVIERLEGVEQVDLVGHSLGNLVIRRYLDEQAGPAIDERPLAGQAAGERPGMGRPEVGRIVMLAPPNQGAQLATRFARLAGLPAIGGGVVEQLGDGWEEVAPRLAVPAGPFGIIAGAGRGANGANPLIDGLNDWVVGVEETLLPGAADFRVVPVGHTFIMDDAQVRRMVHAFLEHGYFESEAARRPIDERGEVAGGVHGPAR